MSPLKILAHILFLSLFLTLLPSNCANRTLHLGLHAPWSHTPTSSEATAWLAQTIGNYAVLPFLQSLVSLLPTPPTPITQRTEQQLVLNAIHAQAPNSLVKSTLSWILHARQFSPHVQLHHSIANETLTAFSTSRPSVATASVFAVEVNIARTVAKLLRHPSHVVDCSDCMSVGLERAQDPLPFALRLPREIEFAARCDRNAQLPLVIVYAHLVSSEFGEWLKTIVDALEQCTHRFALRFWAPADENTERRQDGPILQGYTMHVALKSTEYKVIDDHVFSTRLFPDCPYGSGECDQTRVGSLGDEFAWREITKEDETPLTYSGAKMIKFIRDVSEGDLGKALNILQTITEDTPSLVRSERFLGFETPSSDETKTMVRKVRRFREKVGNDDYLFVNGHALDLYSASQNMGQLLHCLSVATVTAMNRDLVRSEAGVTVGNTLNREESAAVKNTLRIDLGFGNKVRSSLVWFNDVYNDSRYKAWPSLNLSNVDDVVNFQSMIEKRGKLGTRPGTEHLQLAKVKSHHLSLVVILDPGDAQQFAYTSIPQMIVRSDLPIRTGLVLIPNGRVSSLVAASFHYFLRMKGRKTCASFLQMIQQVLQYVGGGFQQVPLSEQIVELAFQQIALKLNGPYATAADVLERDEEIKATLQEAQSFAQERELFSRTDDFEQQANDEDLMQLSLLGILNGIVLKDISSDVIPVALMEQARIAKFLELSSTRGGLESENQEAASDFEQWVVRDPRLIVVEGLSQEMRKGDKRLSRFKSDDDERRISGTTLFHLREEMKSVRYLNSTTNGNGTSGPGVTVWVAGTDHESENFKDMTAVVQELATSGFSSRTNARFAVLEPGSVLHSSVVESGLSENSSQTLCLAINGRIVPASQVKSIDDLKVEVATEFERILSLSGGPGDTRVIEGLLAEDAKSACSSDVRERTMRDLRVSYSEMLEAVSESNVSTFAFRNSDDGPRQAPLLEVYAVVNPLEKNAFISSAVLTALHEAYSFDSFLMTVLMVPTATEVKAQIDHPSVFSKFLIETKSRFEDGSETRVPSLGVFFRLPQQKVLTVSVEPPRAWFVASYATNYDMDNVVLVGLPERVKNLHAEYELRNLIVEGSCIDEEDNPPQGLKLILENDVGIAVDTLVMSNLGYFQLKTPTPGRWILRLAAGASSEVFSLKVMEMYTGFVKTVYKADSTGRVPILVESLSGAGGILLRVERNPGMAGKSVLDPDTTPKSTSQGRITDRLRAKITSFYNWKAEAPLEKSTPPSHSAAKINIFSVASGHLYERFLKIMMSSVTKHSSRPVKFWLLENYLSPSFKKMLPLFAKKLGCEVAMVTYKWPGWLRSQTEKQRIIWAYKILFLDVLFPLDVERIIFVDSDQVIRGDLAELMDIDLQGAPYGYVPFCDSRKEVEGYRFWKQGFWKDTLQGAKYRISALYVVDLNRFRETAAGDTLRLIYQSLSADPNSLANLDQDLPNYASVSPMGGNVVPIFDLPAEWLWCETWCDDESKKTAKAIDLCNNPMTKEPKLHSAKRIISEWVDYDDSALHLTEEIYKELVSNESNGERDDVQNSTTCRPGESCDALTDTDDSQKIEL